MIRSINKCHTSRGGVFYESIRCYRNISGIISWFAFYKFWSNTHLLPLRGWNIVKIPFSSNAKFSKKGNGSFRRSKMNDLNSTPFYNCNKLVETPSFSHIFSFFQSPKSCEPFSKKVKKAAIITTKKYYWSLAGNGPFWSVLTWLLE